MQLADVCPCYLRCAGDDPCSALWLLTFTKIAPRLPGLLLQPSRLHSFPCTCHVHDAAILRCSLLVLPAPKSGRGLYNSLSRRRRTNTHAIKHPDLAPNVSAADAQADKDEHFAPFAQYLRLERASDVDEGGDARLLDLVALLDDMLAPEQAKRPTMAKAHADMTECLAALMS